METIDVLCDEIRQRIGAFLARETAMTPEEINAERYAKFRKL